MTFAFQIFGLGGEGCVEQCLAPTLEWGCDAEVTCVPPVPLPTPSQGCTLPESSWSTPRSVTGMLVGLAASITSVRLEEEASHQHHTQPLGPAEHQLHSPGSPGPPPTFLSLLATRLPFPQHPGSVPPPTPCPYAHTPVIHIRHPSRPSPCGGTVSVSAMTEHRGSE